MTFAQYIGLGLLAVATVVLCYLALTRNMNADIVDGGTGSSSLAGSTDPSPGAGTTDGSGGGVVASTPASTSAQLPNVTNQVDADFASGAPLPSGGRIYDNEGVATGMALTGGALVQGSPRGDNATSSLEVQLASPVQKLAATVSFTGDKPGNVVLVAWQDSLVDARTAGRPVPVSGMRLEVGQSGWQLTLYRQGVVTLDSGTYDTITGSADIALYREGDRAFVVDPSGKVTTFRDPAISSLAGPWACWQLSETGLDQTPATIQAVKAG